MDAPQPLEAERDALENIKRNAESQLIALDAINAPDDDPARINARWNYTEASAALAAE